LDEKWRARAHDEIRNSVAGIVEAMGGTVDVKIISGYPSLFNHVHLTDTVSMLAKEFIGNENIIDLPIRMTGEDFARYSQKYASVFYRMGTGYPDRKNYPVHHPQFEVNEEAIGISTEMLSYITMSLANS